MRRVEESGEPVGDLALEVPSISRTSRVINRNFGLAEPEFYPSAQVPALASLIRYMTATSS